MSIYSDLGEIFDEGRHPRAKLGFVLLSTERTIEDDIFQLRPQGVGAHFTRAYNDDDMTVETLSNQVNDLARASSTLLPDGSLDVVCYACTSASLLIGEERVLRELSKGAPSARATTLISGVLRGLGALGVRRVSVATPYLDEINAREVEYMEEAGFEISAIRGLNLDKDADMVRVSPQAIGRLAASVDRPDADAVFVSCGALRTLDIVEALEQELGKPIICSNQAMMWDVMRLAGLDDRITGYGTLLRDH